MVARETVLSEGLAQLGLSASKDANAIERLARLTEFLETEGVRRGFISARDTSRILSRHVLECAALQSWLPPGDAVVDVGSGAGLPGLVLACLRTNTVILIEAAARRAAFLREVSHELGLVTEVLANRAEEVARGAMRDASAAVVARALAKVPVALELTLPLAAVGGLAALLIGAEDAGKATWESSAGVASRVGPAAEAAEALGGAAPVVHGFEVPGANARRWVMIVRKLRPTPDLYPRSVQALRRRPLGGGVT